MVYQNKEDDILGLAQEVLKLVQKREELFKHNKLPQFTNNVSGFPSPVKDNKKPKQSSRSRKSQYVNGKNNFSRMNTGMSDLKSPGLKQPSLQKISSFGVNPNPMSYFNRDRQSSFNKLGQSKISNKNRNASPDRRSNTSFNLDPNKPKLRDNFINGQIINERKSSNKKMLKEQQKVEARRRRDKLLSEQIHNAQFQRQQQQDQVFVNMYERMQILEEQKKERIKRLKDQRKFEENKLMQSKPEINKKSRLMIRSKSVKPIYQRTNDILKTKKENLAKIKKKVVNDREEKNEHITFIPNYKSVMRRLEKEREEEMFNPKLAKRQFDTKKSFDFVFDKDISVGKKKRSHFDKFFDRQEKFLIRQRVNKKRISYKEINKEMKEVTGVPVISRRTKKLGKRHNKKTSKSRNVDERLFFDARDKKIRQQRLEDSYIKKNCTFHPEISQLPDFVLQHREDKIHQYDPVGFIPEYEEVPNYDYEQEDLRTPTRPIRYHKYAKHNSRDSSLDGGSILLDNRSELIKTVDRLENLAYKSGMKRTVAYRDNSFKKDRDFNDNLFLHSFKDFAVDVAEPDTVRPNYIAHRSGKLNKMRAKLRSGKKRKSSSKKSKQNQLHSMDYDDHSMSFIMNTLKKY